VHAGDIIVTENLKNNMHSILSSRIFTFMKEIFEYFDYQLFLRDFYEEKKVASQYFSYRYIAQRVGIDHALIVKILQGKRHLSEKTIPAFISLLGLSKKKAQYFELLVLYGKAQTDRDAKHYFEKLLACSSCGARVTESSQYEFYQKWYYTAVRELLNIKPFTGDFEQLAESVQPAITPKQARTAISLLEKLKLIKIDSEGVYRLTDQFITTGTQWQSMAVREFQRQTMELASSALGSVAVVERDISTMTLTLDKEGFARAKERIAQMQKELCDIAAACNLVDRVYQVNVQVFPLSKTIPTPQGFTQPNNEGCV
jgi:uncharacterized protein (TIGR02147 family)